MRGCPSALPPLLLVILALLLPGPAPAGEGSVFGEVGVEVSEGDFGTGTELSTAAVAATVGYRAERWELSATVPFVSVSSRGVVVFTGAGPAPVPGAVPTSGPAVPVVSGGSGADRASGLGDATVRGAFLLLAGTERRPSVAPWVAVKLPTGDEEEGLGSGETDVGVGSVVSASWGRLFGSVDAGYTFVGEPEGLDFDDVVSTLLTVGYRPVEAVGTYGVLDYRTAVVDGTEDPVVAGAGVAYTGGGFGLKGEVRIGLTDSAPDVAGSVSLSYRF
ncbi:MAG TPA: transporter [Thermodesulfobacteriota bacterium]|nr:transporter [Thermodesulfobacteriota bacterium]